MRGFGGAAGDFGGEPAIAGSGVHVGSPRVDREAVEGGVAEVAAVGNHRFQERDAEVVADVAAQVVGDFLLAAVSRIVEARQEQEALDQYTHPARVRRSRAG
jgi:hypothetical protein